MKLTMRSNKTSLFVDGVDINIIQFPIKLFRYLLNKHFKLQKIYKFSLEKTKYNKITNYIICEQRKYHIICL